MEKIDHMEELSIWEDNTKMDFQVRSREGVDWIHPTRDRENLWALLSSVMNFRVPYYEGNFLCSSASNDLARATLRHEVSYVEWKLIAVLVTIPYILLGTRQNMELETWLWEIILCSRRRNIWEATRNRQATMFRKRKYVKRLVCTNIVRQKQAESVPFNVLLLHIRSRFGYKNGYKIHSLLSLNCVTLLDVPEDGLLL